MCPVISVVYTGSNVCQTETSFCLSPASVSSNGRTAIRVQAAWSQAAARCLPCAEERGLPRTPASSPRLGPSCVLAVPGRP